MDASPLVFSRLCCPRSGRGSSAKYPRHCPACWPQPCPVRIRVRGQSVPATSPRPRLQFVRVREQSTFETCPQSCPCPVRRRKVSGIMSSPCPRTIRFHNHSMDNPESRPVGSHATSATRPRSHRRTVTCTHLFRRKAARADQPLGVWARESKFNDRSPGGASMSCSPCCPLRSTLHPPPVPGVLL